MDDTFEIKLLVGGTYYPLTIQRKDEAMYREAARRLNTMLNRYKDHFPQLNEEKYYVMASLNIAELDGSLLFASLNLILQEIDFAHQMGICFEEKKIHIRNQEHHLQFLR